MSEKLLHDDECDCVRFGFDNREWVAADGFWGGDEQVCTCDLKTVMARRAIYGDEQLVQQLPFTGHSAGEGEP